ncbi:alpha-glucosidase C-terminal domain-containing protein, partial [Lacticaseibacillus paracasei]
TIYSLYPLLKVVSGISLHPDPDSVFFFYQKLNQLRKQYPALIVYGDYELLDPDDSDVFMYRRFTDDQELLVINNFTDQEQSRPISTRLPKNARLMISNYADDRGDVLRPYETRSYLGERR